MNEIWNDIIDKDLNKKKSISQLRVLNIINKKNGPEIEINGKKYLNFSGNDYLGLSDDKRIIDKGIEYAESWGAGVVSSRLISGSIKPFEELETNLADLTEKESSLFFNSGYQANVGLISSLADRNTVIFTDKLNHASIYDGIILSRAKFARFEHCDMNSLENELKKYKDIKKKIIITDSVFSMDGDIAPLSDIADLAEKYQAFTIVDEAHSFGIWGKNGAGLVSELKLNKKIDIIMGTTGKALGVFGAFASADKKVIEYLINNSRAFIFSTALPAFVIGALLASLEIIKNEKRGKVLIEKSALFRERLIKNKINILNSRTQIIPVITNDNESALNLMNHLKSNGIFAPAVRPPAVPQNSSRVRISLSYYHITEDIDKLFDLIINWFNKGK